MCTLTSFLPFIAQCGSFTPKPSHHLVRALTRDLPKPGGRNKKKSKRPGTTRSARKQVFAENSTGLQDLYFYIVIREHRESKTSRLTYTRTTATCKKAKKKNFEQAATQIINFGRATETLYLKFNEENFVFMERGRMRGLFTCKKTLAFGTAHLEQRF